MADNISKQIESSTKVIARQLEEFEKNRKSTVSRLEAAEKELKELSALSKRALDEAGSMIQAMMGTRKQIDAVLDNCQGINRAVEVSKDSEMVQRRLLDARKACQQMQEDWEEKYKAYESNKGDKKCKTEFEIANKAFLKVASDCEDLMIQANNLMPAGMMEYGEMVTKDLPTLMRKYEADVLAMIKAIGGCSAKEVDRELELYLRYKPKG